MTNHLTINEYCVEIDAPAPLQRVIASTATKMRRDGLITGRRRAARGAPYEFAWTELDLVFHAVLADLTYRHYQARWASTGEFEEPFDEADSSVA